MVEKNREIVRRILEGESPLTDPKARRKLQASIRTKKERVLDERDTDSALAQIIGPRPHAIIHGRN